MPQVGVIKAHTERYLAVRSCFAVGTGREPGPGQTRAEGVANTRQNMVWLSPGIYTPHSLHHHQPRQDI